MAVHTRDFRQARPLQVDMGQPFRGGWRHALRYQSTVDLAANDDIYLYGKVPAGEVWRIRSMRVVDATAAGVANDWRRQDFGVIGPRALSPVAAAATWRPLGEWTREAAGGPVVPIWRRDWDGTTYLRWIDANGAPLVVRDSDPGVGPMVLPPNECWRLDSLGGQTAGAAERVFELDMIVDRLAHPGPADAALAYALAARAED